MKFPWTILKEQSAAIEMLRQRIRSLEDGAEERDKKDTANYKELRAACVAPNLFCGSSIIRSLYPDVFAEHKPYTAMDAVRLLLEHNGLAITAEPAKDAKHKLEPIKAAKKR